MPYEWKTDKNGRRRFSRVGTLVRAIPKGTVTIEPAQPATVAKVDIDSGEAVAVETADLDVADAAVSVPTTPKSTAKKSTAKKS